MSSCRIKEAQEYFASMVATVPSEFSPYNKAKWSYSLNYNNKDTLDALGKKFISLGFDNAFVYLSPEAQEAGNHSYWILSVSKIVAHTPESSVIEQMQVEEVARSAGVKFELTSWVPIFSD